MKKSTIICAAVLAVTVIVMAVLIIVGIKKNSCLREQDNTTATETVIDKEPDDTDSVVPPISTDKPTTTANPDDLPDWLDVENDPRPQKPYVSDSSAENGVKDE